MKRFIAPLILLTLLALACSCSLRKSSVPETPDVSNIKISGARMVGGNTTVSFKYDTKEAEGGTAIIEIWDPAKHMRDQHTIILKKQKGTASWTLKPTFAAPYQFWITVKNSEDEGTTNYDTLIKDTDSTDPRIKRELGTKWTGFYNMEYQNLHDWPEYENWNGNVLLLSYNDNTVRIVGRRDINMPVRNGVIENDELIFIDKKRNTVHKIKYESNMRLIGIFESPPGTVRADISMVRNVKKSGQSQ